MGLSRDKCFVNCGCHINICYQLDLVVQVCNPATWEAEAGENSFKASLGNNFVRTCLSYRM